MDNFRNKKQLPPLPEENDNAVEIPAANNKNKSGKLDSKAQKSEPAPKEKIIIQERIIERREGGGMGCRAIGCFIMLTLFLLCFGTIFVIITKPDSIWSKVVDFLNNDIVVETETNYTYDAAKADVDRQLKSIGNNEIVINEDMMTVLARNNIDELKNLTIDVESSDITIYWQLDDTVENNPLWGIVTIKLDNEGDPYIEKIGTNRIGLPSIVNKQITTLILRLLDLGQGSSENPNSIVRNLITSNEDMQVDEIILEKDQIKLKVSVDVSFF